MTRAEDDEATEFQKDKDGAMTDNVSERIQQEIDANDHANDTYTPTVPLADFAAGDVLLAWSWNGEPISREHGGPLRVVIPRLYFWKSAKWIKRIEFSPFDKPGFWEVRGYHNYGDPWREQRYDEEK